MTGLPKSIIKKYGVTKKAWAVFRGSNTKRAVTAHKRKTHTGGNNMAKKKSHKKSSSSKKFLGMGAGMVGALLYGAGREKISNKLAPLTNKIPLGSISDEIGMFGTCLLAEKYGNKIPMVGKYVADAGRVGKYIELARVGEAFVNGQVSLGSIGGSTSSNGIVDR